MLIFNHATLLVCVMLLFEYLVDHECALAHFLRSRLTGFVLLCLIDHLLVSFDLCFEVSVLVAEQIEMTQLPSLSLLNGLNAALHNCLLSFDLGLHDVFVDGVHTFVVCALGQGGGLPSTWGEEGGIQENRRGICR